MANIPVKWFDYDTLVEAGGAVPVLTGQPGTLISLLSACLVDGFNVKVPQSISVSNGVGAVTFPSSGHGFVEHQVVKITGADHPAINGDWRVLSVSSTGITLDMQGVADGPVTGNNMDIRAAPLGWSKPFTGTKKAAFRSQSQDATGCYLRVDDSVGQYAKVRGYENLTDIDTGTGMFPTESQRTESNWGKSNTSDSTSRKWTIIGDDRFFYLVVHIGYDNPNTHPNNRIGVAFGDIISFKEGDIYNAILYASNQQQVRFMQGESYGNVLHKAYDVSASARGILARAHTQLGGSIDTYFMSMGASDSGFSALGYPNSVDNGLLVSKGKLVVETTSYTQSASSGSGHAVRGELPGYYHCLQHRPLTHGSVVCGAVPGRKLMIIGTAYNWDGEYSARFALDITGPWR